MLNSHLTLSFDRYFIKIYKIDNHYVIAELGNDYEMSKSDKVNHVVKYLMKLMLGYPAVDLLFNHNSTSISKNRKTNLNRLLKKSNDKIITADIIKSYLRLLW
jgi:hypothetical protein